MSVLGNIIWLVFGGFVTGLGYILGGLVLCLTIIGIPFGIQAIKLGTATMTPFGRKIVEDANPNSTLKSAECGVAISLWLGDRSGASLPCRPFSDHHYWLALCQAAH